MSPQSDNPKVPESRTHSASFATPEQPRASIASVLLFIMSSVLVFGGFWVMSLAFSHPDTAVWLFSGGIVLDAVGLWMAFGLAPRFAKR
ncbi:hypothetical protein JSO19_02840 [Leucobacter sp. UCMA 4100]|uniref:hypothetical protein n=1 Tax=Leucobacter sp. UCMA 4100 TaxID=2810534 RepID=UPI0022EA3E4E|nr:hypothetical protein [Leucobacter sp. UCMA 4100]MDA3146314.1 hypothetical protein [Leucobacter sp. UCMA 4100]